MRSGSRPRTASPNQLRGRLNATASVTAHLDRAEAFDGADFVVNMIQVGGLASTRIDFEVPARHGIRQTIADTLGIGGIFRALRTFPALDGIAADMRRVCPDAWLLNYTNPMAMNLTYLARTAPDIKAVGLCHSVYWTVHDLGELIGVPIEEASYWSAGVNHQAWLLRWERDGEDLYPLARRARSPPTPSCCGASASTCIAGSATTRRRRASTRRSTSAWYLKHADEVERLRLEPGMYVGISEENVATYERTKAQLAAGEQIELESIATEYAPQIVHSMVTAHTPADRRQRRQRRV